MFKKYFVLIFILAFSFSHADDGNRIKTDSLSVAEIKTNAAIYVDKEVSIIGIVEHVCKHGGKRLFLMGDNPKDRFKITAGSDVGAFNVELEGSEILVKGIVVERKIDEAFIDNWEVEITTDSKPEVAHEGHVDGKEEEENKDEIIAEALIKVNNMRDKLEKSDKDYLSFYSLECQSFIEIK